MYNVDGGRILRRGKVLAMKKILPTILLLFSLSPAHAVLLHTESFEVPPGGGYTLSTAFDDGSFDYFDRYAVPDNTNAARDDFQIEGVLFLVEILRGSVSLSSSRFLLDDRFNTQSF
jgi:hypothetical protein